MSSASFAAHSFIKVPLKTSAARVNSQSFFVVGHPADAAIPIIAFCHLRWNWVWQRPQQFLSRLARTHPVLFVEFHFAATPVSFTRIYNPANSPGVVVLEMHAPAHRASDGQFIDQERRRLLIEALNGELRGQFDGAALWFNDPMAVTAFAGHLGEKAIVYDCMDELTQFANPPPALAERERELLQKADVVFCGGRKMRDKRRPLNSNAHFYGTGVDCIHFGAALTDALPVAPEIAALGQPVLGYFGVIDERIDYELLAKLADVHPEWSIAMVGPVVKVDPRFLPRRANLHWMGARHYAALPAITKGFSVCLMPFARNAATEYINPTKALEYMAAGKPVISTALDEVKTNFSRVARIAYSSEEFIALCEREISKPSKSRIASGLKLARENTWEAIVAKLDAHLSDVLKPQIEPSLETPVVGDAIGKALYV